MKIKIKAGQRVLYKDGNSEWLVGIVDNGEADVNEQGVWIPIIPLRFAHMAVEDVPYIQCAEINNIFTDAVEIEDWMKPLLIPKEEYIKIIQEDGFERALENAWVSDGEYYYYPVSTYTDRWIRKQPFSYILRNN